MTNFINKKLNNIMLQIKHGIFFISLIILLPISCHAISLHETWKYYTPKSISGNFYVGKIYYNDSSQYFIFGNNDPGWNNFLYLLHANNGSLRWKSHVGGPNRGLILIDEKDNKTKNIMVATDWGEKKIKVIDSKDGRIIWSKTYNYDPSTLHQTEKYIIVGTYWYDGIDVMYKNLSEYCKIPATHVRVINTYDDLLFFVEAPSTLYLNSINLTNCKKLWKFEDIRFFDIFKFNNNRFIVGYTQNGIVYVMYLNGTIFTRINNSGLGPEYGGICKLDNKNIIVALDNRVYKINIFSHQNEWNYTTADHIYIVKCKDVNNDNLNEIIISTKKMLYILNNIGSELVVKNISNLYKGLEISDINDDGLPEIFVGTTDGYVYAFTVILNETEENISAEFSENNSIFIVDNVPTNIISALPLRMPLLIYDGQNGEEIRDFIEDYKPERIYLLGVNLTYNSINASMIKINRSDVQKFFGNESAVYISDLSDKEKVIYASMIAYYTHAPILLPGDSTNGYEEIINASEKSNEELKQIYINKVKAKGKGLNYIVVANINDNASLLSGRIASMHEGYIILFNISDIEYPTGYINGNAYFWNDKNKAIDVKNEIRRVAEELKNKGVLLTPEYYKEGAFLLLLGGMPYYLVDDPVENGNALWKDNSDMDWFKSDLAYGDINDDGYLELAVGRIYGTMEEVVLWIERANLKYERGKALLAGEYLFRLWPEVLLYVGGGMMQTKSLESVLKNQGYEVMRLVEYRSDLKGFLSDLMPGNIKELMNSAKRVEERVTRFLGANIGKIIKKVFVVIKALEYIEQALEIYLEYDFSSFNLNWDKGYAMIDYAINNPPSGEDWEDFVVNIILILFPNRYPELNTSNLLNHMPNSKIIYYEGIGNETGFILPNAFDASDPWQLLFSSPYNGSNYFDMSMMPKTKASIVWVNSDNAAKKMGKRFIEQGARSFIGAHAVVYAPYSSAIDIEFFKNGNTVGNALRDAINALVDNWLVWDPYSFILRGGINNGARVKALKEFVLFGDPKMEKDPMQGDEYEPEVSMVCRDRCVMKVKFVTPYKLMNTGNKTTAMVRANSYLMNPYYPILPLLKLKQYLPYKARVMNYSIEYDYVEIPELEMPLAVPAPHSGNGSLNYFEASYDVYPERFYRVSFNDTWDNRSVLNLILSPIQLFNNSNDRIYTNINITLSIEAPAMLSLKARDVFEGEQANVCVNVWAKKHVNGTLVLVIYNGSSIERNASVDLINESKQYNFSFNLARGTYNAKAYLFGEYVIGPITKIFKVMSGANISTTGSINVSVLDNETEHISVHFQNYGDEACDVKLYNSKISDGMEIIGDAVFESNKIHIEGNGFAETLLMINVSNHTLSGTYYGSVGYECKGKRKSIDIVVYVPERPDIEVAPKALELDSVPGGKENVTIKIVNSGNTELDLNITGYNEMLPLMPGEEANITLAIGIPEVFVPKARGYITIRDEISGKEWYVLYTIWLRYVYWNASFPEIIKLDGDSKYFMVWIENKANSTDKIENVSITTVSKEFEIGYEWGDVIEKGHSKGIRVYIKGRGVEEGTYNLPLKIRVDKKSMPIEIKKNVSVEAVFGEYRVRKVIWPGFIFSLFGFQFPSRHLATIRLDNIRGTDRVEIMDNIKGFEVKRVWSNEGNVQWSANNTIVRINVTGYGTKRLIVKYIMKAKNIRHAETLRGVVRAYKAYGVYKDKGIKARIKYYRLFR